MSWALVYSDLPINHIMRRKIISPSLELFTISLYLLGSMMSRRRTAATIEHSRQVQGLSAPSAPKAALGTARSRILSYRMENKKFTNGDSYRDSGILLSRSQGCRWQYRIFRLDLSFACRIVGYDDETIVIGFSEVFH